MDHNFYLFVIAGFLAQMVDGVLGMAYGVSCSSLLLALGVTPAIASASVHAAKFFTTSFSGFFHWKLGNVDPEVWKKLVLPGVIGGVIGVVFLTRVPVDFIRPVISAYLLFIGASIVLKAFKKQQVVAPKTNRLKTLGFVGGFADAIGGGGWGPIVTSSLVAQGNDPRLTVGSVNLAEFFVATATSITFMSTIGLVNTWGMISGLVVGGLVAAPFAAWACKKVDPKPLMVAVGILIIGLSVTTLASLVLKAPLLAHQHQSIAARSTTVAR
jgi:uncharacterized membrane protein YfcA